MHKFELLILCILTAFMGASFVRAAKTFLLQTFDFKI